MKVLKDGSVGDPAYWKRKVVCEKFDEYDKEGCGAELEIGEKDLVHMYFEGEYFPHSYAAIKCPQCGKYTRVNDVPDPIWQKVKKITAMFDGWKNGTFSPADFGRKG